MTSYEILVRGAVQGVGFRPAVFRIAKKLELNGHVTNTHEGVRIVCCLQEHQSESLLEDIRQKLTEENFQLTHFLISKIVSKEEKGFRIVLSEGGRASFYLPKDVGICDDCLAEWRTDSNRRQGYPLISCIKCGSRYTLMRSGPYEREHLSIDTYTQCSACQREYDDPKNPRFHSQTNVCGDCGPKIFFSDKNGISYSQHALDKAKWKIKEGAIIGVKGTGGFLFMCSALSDRSIERLREIKGRQSKPFAVLFSGERQVQSFFNVTQNDLIWLSSPARPILFLRKNLTDYRLSQLVSPDLDSDGCYFPSSALLADLCDEFPMIATSGNVSGEPMYFDGIDFTKRFGVKIDGILDYELDIHFPLDDSVMQATNSNRRIIIRNARGLAPISLPLERIMHQPVSLMAMGAQEKSAFSCAVDQMIYSSGYIGDLENFDSQLRFKSAVEKFRTLLNFSPEFILIDPHPNYFSAAHGRILANELKIGLKQVQHHHAHFASVLHENSLLESEEPILGVIWDGTGFGLDGKIWGGEFFQFTNDNFDRVLHLDYVPLILGEKMIKEPKIAALAFCENEPELLKHCFDDEEEYKYLLRKTDSNQSIETSGIGRLFDAVSYILTGLEINSYNGQAALHLENLAQKHLDSSQWQKLETLPFGDGLRLDGCSLFRSILLLKESGTDKSLLAARFHFTLVKKIKEVAQILDIKKLCFSGGVFQNKILNELLEYFLKEQFELYFHINYSPNDDSISHGQIIAACLGLATDVYEA